MRPIIEELENRYRDQVDFYFVNIDESSSEALVEQYHVRAVPTYILLDGKGNTTAQWVGSVGEQELVQAFENALASR